MIQYRKHKRSESTQEDTTSPSSSLSSGNSPSSNSRKSNTHGDKSDKHITSSKFGRKNPNTKNRKQIKTPNFNKRHIRSSSGYSSHNEETTFR